MQVLFPDNTTATHTIEDMTAWHLSMGAFTGAGLNTTISESQYGHYMESIDDVAAPERLLMVVEPLRLEHDEFIVGVFPSRHG
jgi:hypothetical protein